MVTATDVGLLVLRLGFGLGAAAHGAEKLGLFGGPGLKGAVAMMDKTGFTPGSVTGPMAAAVETGAGLAVAAGLATGPAGAALAGNMAVAASLHGFEKVFAKDGGPEMSLAYGLVGKVLVCTGPGALSLDALTRGVLNRPWMRAVALVAAGAAAGAIIVRRRAELARRAALEASDPSIRAASAE